MSPFNNESNLQNLLSIRNDYHHFKLRKQVDRDLYNRMIKKLFIEI